MVSNLFEYINPRYLQGISDEPKQLLQPITGYAREPLLSLEEACEPLLTIVSNLPAHIWVAKQNSKNPADGLTQDESASIRLYTMEWDGNESDPRSSLYSHLNRTLKLVDRTKLRPWFLYLKLFLTALAKLPIAPRQTIWRGVRRDYSADYPPGSEATWWAFSSCTTSLSVLESDLYLGNVGTRTLFSIETFNARTVRDHSHFTAEDEILLLPGTFFEVKSRLNPAPDLHIVHLSQKIPPHNLLEPPFEGARLFPRPESIVSMDNKLDFAQFSQRPWYKRKRWLIALALVLMAIIVAAVLVVVLRTQSKSRYSTILITGVSASYGNRSICPPSVANAFYAFDGDTNDLYGRHNGVPNGDSVSYVQGYVATGEAIVLTQDILTCVDVPELFNLTGLSYTVEAFIIARQQHMTGNIVEFSSGVIMGLYQGYLRLAWIRQYHIVGKELISTNEWHHVGFIYDAINKYAYLYLDGYPHASVGYAYPPVASLTDSTTMKIASSFYGTIDQLSISLTRKADNVILWDATVAAYYPVNNENAWLLDYGPNCLNATADGTQFVKGFCHGGLNFNTTGAYYQSGGFTALATPNRAFTVALWVRPETAPGAFLTVANPSACLLVLGLRSSDNRLVAFLPNSTGTSGDVSIVGPVLSVNQWTHVALTWSESLHAQLYKSGLFQQGSDDVTTLNNGRGGPMVVTLGTYNGKANCQGGAVLNSSQQFMGSLDELYVYSRELAQADVQELVKTPCP